MTSAKETKESKMEIMKSDILETLAGVWCEPCAADLAVFVGDDTIEEAAAEFVEIMRDHFCDVDADDVAQAMREILA